MMKMWDQILFALLNISGMIIDTKCEKLVEHFYIYSGYR